MIISHKHKFIFVKTGKTAGTSLEIALSRICGEDDVITPVSDNDEDIRKQMGGLSPRNYKIPFKNYRFSDMPWMLYRMALPRFYNHDSALFIKRHVPENIWKNYYKFCFERNPWDKVVSLYFYKTKKWGKDPGLSMFIENTVKRKPITSEMYMHKGEFLVDKVYKYEEMKDALNQIEKKLQLPEKLELPMTKHTSRAKKNYKEILSEADKNRISELFKFQIETFGYTYDQTTE